jgi:uncharacterized protein (TIGR02145 family)
MKEKSRILIYPLVIMGLVLILTTTCKKKEEVPVLTTYVVNEITITTATCGGLILSDGGAAITARGVCWSTGETPTLADSKTTSSTSAASFTCTSTDLTGGTTYYVRAYATNSAGTGYGTAVSFTTLPVELPVLTTSAVSEIADITATCGGNITSDGGSAITARGVCWSIAATPTTADSKTTDGTGTGEFTSSITGLTAGTIYYVRAYATNSAGTAYGTAVSFSTLAPQGAPELTTSAVSDITQTTATCGGNITSEGTSAVTARGVCWGTGDSPTTADSKTTDGTGTGEFTSSITDLTAETTYYVRAYATNSIGTAYGTAVSFTTEEGVITDFDGNVYTKVTIGTQVWMVEDLRTTHYNNGDSIPNVTGQAEWVALTTPGYTWYNNEEATSYGAYYNWYTVNTGNLCPTGWHVPTDAEWTTLITYLGGDTEAGGKLKEVGTTHYVDPNTGATNGSGFTALPGGYRNLDGPYYDLGNYGFWWSSTEIGTNAWSRNTHNSTTIVERNENDKHFGFLVRCLKDN